MLNQIVLMGRLVRDPELRATQSQTPVCSFRIAVDRDYGARGEGGNVERQTDFIDIVAWRQSAEFVKRYFTKGSLIIVVGRLQMREWTDREGNKRISAEVQADRVMFGETKRSREENAGAGRGGSYGQGGGYSGGGYSGGGYSGGGNSYDGRRNSYDSAAPQDGGYGSLDDMSGESAFSELGESGSDLPF